MEGYDDIESVLAAPRYSPRPIPSQIPTVGIFDEPTVGICINAEWAVHFYGVIEALDQPDTWIGTDEQIDAARQQIREAILRFMGDCVSDPCCPETNELLLAIQVLNQTIVDNQITIINQNTTQEFASYQSTYNTYVTNNQNLSILNQMLYDGTPQSLFPALGEGTTFESAGEARLCGAIEAYINGQIYIHANETANIAAAGQATIAASLAAAAALSILTGGLSMVVGIALSAVLNSSLQAWTDLLNDREAQRAVRCCMFDALNGADITEANFQTSVDSCGFDSGSSEAMLAQQISHDNHYYPENWLAFLRALQQNAGNSVENCDCECDAAELELIAVNDCVVTRLTDTTWRIQQSNYTIPDPTHPENRRYTVKVREEMYRCMDIIGYDESTAYYYQTDCDGVEVEGLGGGGGMCIRFEWHHGQNEDYHDIDAVLTLACPE